MLLFRLKHLISGVKDQYKSYVVANILKMYMRM